MKLRFSSFQFATCITALHLGNHCSTLHAFLKNTTLSDRHTSDVIISRDDADLLTNALCALKRSHETLFTRDERVPEGHDSELLIDCLLDARAGELDEIDKGRPENFVLYGMCL